MQTRPIMQSESSATLGGRVPVDGYAVACVWTLALVLLWQINADPDLWGHLKFGLDTLRTGAVRVSDPYSFTSDAPWINHEWLSEVQMALAYRVAGASGLFALKFALLAVVAITLTKQYRGLPSVIQGPAIIITMWSAAPMLLTIRPQLWSYALVALVAVLLAHDRPSRRLLWLPPLFAFWVNVHGGWIIGLWLLGTWGLFRVGDRRWRWWVVSIAIATTLATFLNPYGWRLWVFIQQTVSLDRGIREWWPLTMAPLSDWWPWLLTVAAATAIELSQRQRSLTRIVTIGVLAYSSFRVVRVIPFFVLVAVLYVSEPVRDLSRRYPWLNWRPRAPSRKAAALTLIPALVMVGTALPTIAAVGTCIPISGFWVPDPPTAMALQQARPTGRLVTAFGWSQYAIWHFGPALRVSFDGRRETVYSEAQLKNLWWPEFGLPESLPLLSQLNPDYVWLPKSETRRVRDWLAANGYRIDVESKEAWLAVRSDRPKIQPAAAVPPACFPG